MFVFRPIRDRDLPGLVRLASGIAGGLTTLPPDRKFLQERIDDSLQAFNARVRQPGGEWYLFVLEDTDKGEIVGTSGVAARVGGFEPWYSYEIRTERFEHRPLHIEKEMRVLHLKEEHRGPTEIGSLYLRPDRRRGGNGRLLSLARFLFIAAFPRRFTDAVIAEMRGYIDQTGRSPFWEGVGRHFFDFDFYRADLLSGLGNKEFIRDLMPDHPIYVALLAPEVQAAIGRVHHDTEPALALLNSEGFAATNEVDIFDAGPQLRAPTSEIRTVRQARAARIRSAAAPLSPGPAGYLLANGALDFRAVAGNAELNADGSVTLDSAAAGALELEAGDTVWLAPIRAA